MILGFPGQPACSSTVPCHIDLLHTAILNLVSRIRHLRICRIETCRGHFSCGRARGLACGGRARRRHPCTTRRRPPPTPMSEGLLPSHFSPWRQRRGDGQRRAPPHRLRGVGGLGELSGVAGAGSTGWQRHAVVSGGQLPLELVGPPVGGWRARHAPRGLEGDFAGLAHIARLGPAF